MVRATHSRRAGADGGKRHEGVLERRHAGEERSRDEDRSRWRRECKGCVGWVAR